MNKIDKLIAVLSMNSVPGKPWIKLKLSHARTIQEILEVNLMTATRIIWNLMTVSRQGGHMAQFIVDTTKAPVKAVINAGLKGQMRNCISDRPMKQWERELREEGSGARTLLIRQPRTRVESEEDLVLAESQVETNIKRTLIVQPDDERIRLYYDVADMPGGAMDVLSAMIVNAQHESEVVDCRVYVTDHLYIPFPPPVPLSLEYFADPGHEEENKLYRDSFGEIISSPPCMATPERYRDEQESMDLLAQ